MKTIPLLLATLLLLGGPAAGADDDDPVPGILRRLKDKDPEVRLRAVFEAEDVQDEKVTRELLRLIPDKSDDVRIAVLPVLGARTGEGCRKRAAVALAARLGPLAGKRPDSEEYRLTIQALHDLARPEAVDALLDIDLDEDRDTARSRLMAVGNIPSPEAIEGLITFMSRGRNKGSNRQRELARDALRYATGLKLGNDPDKWREWWRSAKKTFDFEAAAAKRLEDREKKSEAADEKSEKRRKRDERRGKRNGKKKGGDDDGGDDGGEDGAD